MSPGQDQRYEGRLELTWTNKDRRLLVAEDGSYDWPLPSDYRIAEVRLLDHAALVGETRHEKSRARAKDNLEVLAALAESRTAVPQNIKADSIAAVLKAGLADDGARERAADLVHRFGEQGYLTLRSLLD